SLFDAKLVELAAEHNVPRAKVEELQQIFSLLRLCLRLEEWGHAAQYLKRIPENDYVFFLSQTMRNPPDGYRFFRLHRFLSFGHVRVRDHFYSALEKEEAAGKRHIYASGEADVFAFICEALQSSGLPESMVEFFIEKYATHYQERQMLKPL